MSASEQDYVDTIQDAADSWWHIAYADRPGVFSGDLIEAVELADRTGAQFVQERGGDRVVVWEAAP